MQHLLHFRKKFFQFVDMRSATVKLVDTGTSIPQANSMIHSRSNNFTEYNITVIVKKKDMVLLSDFRACPTTSLPFQTATAKGL